MKLKFGNAYKDLDESYLTNSIILEKNYESQINEIDIINNALNNPLGTKKLREITNKNDVVCLVVSDVTRAYIKSNIWLEYIIAELSASGVKDSSIKILCANGAHRKQSKDEHDIILGDKLKDRFEIIDHDCNDKNNLVSFGNTIFGTPIEINKAAVECDKLIITGATTFHTMAGYGGGRKSILPGISSHEAISKNHLQVFCSERDSGLNPKCKLGNIEDNTMHLDMLDACEKINIDFAFNVVLDVNGNICGAFAGNYIDVHRSGMKCCDDVGAVYIKEKADVVIASAGGYPKDINLYQASKAFEVAAESLKDNGTMIILAECSEDMGCDESVDIIKDFNNNSDREDFMREKFSPEAFSGYILCVLAEKYNTILVSDYKNLEELKKSGIKIYRDINEALKGIKKEDKKYILTNATAILPKLS